MFIPIDKVRQGHSPWLALAILLGLFCEVSQAQTRASDWPMFNRDLAGTRYSPLDQINASNVTELELAWSYKLGENTSSGSLAGGSEVTPLVVDGVMYATASDRVIALEPETGKEIWRWELGDRGPPSRRGLGYWPGDGRRPARIFFTSNQLLIGLGAKTGELAVEFNDGGIKTMAASYQGAPFVYENLVVVGSGSAPGGVRAFDAVTGQEVWEFLSLPQEGEYGADTWVDDNPSNRTNAHHWAFSMTMDAERGLLYTVFESAGPHDYWGGNRPGDNLFANSIVALDIATGKRKWHFQAVHHDIWDYDLSAPPGLLDITIDGEVVPILALVAKTGYMYILNRETGEPVFGIEEVPVPQSDAPNERTSPTQPIPVKPPPISKVSYSPEDLVTAEDTTEEHARFCRELIERSGGVSNAGPYTPYVYRAPGAPPRSIILFPGSTGGANWGGTAADPTLGYFFVNTMDEASIGWVEKNPSKNARVPYRRNSILGPTSRFHWYEGDPKLGNIMNSGEGAWLCNKPPWGHLVAVNAATGDIAWKVVLGITEELPEGKQKTGRLSFGGPITTAGGLVFIGATNDRRFRAFDSKTGEELWVTRLDMSARAVPITYLGKDGRQYVAVTASGASSVDTPSPPEDRALIAFALPESSSASAQTTNDPFPAPIAAVEGVIKVDVVEFASIPDIDGQAARVMLLVDEPGTRRMFVNDMLGPLYSVSYDGRTVTRYVDINADNWEVRINSSGRERGMQSFTFHPQFAQAGTPGFGKFYIWTDTSNTDPTPDFVPGGGTRTHDTVLLEWTARTPGAATYDGGAPRELLRFEQPFRNHNGGQIGFNPLVSPGDADFGLLYIGVADGGSGGDPLNLAQNLNSGFGKILRIDPLGSNSANGEYGIPADNPFANDGDDTTLGEIYAYGTRNPQHFAWDSTNGNMFFTEIGQNIVEEISLVTAGANLGWNDWEGSFGFISRAEVSLTNQRGDPRVTYPVAEYDHQDPLLLGRSAATGVYIYRRNSIPQLANRVLWGDLPSGEIFSIDADNPPGGGQAAIRRVLLIHDGEAKTLLQLIQEKNRQQGKQPATRADLRYGAGPDGQVFIMNKHDGTIRLLVPPL